jgi:diguanylate cyclase (GGDEF)-like protein
MTESRHGPAAGTWPEPASGPGLEARYAALLDIGRILTGTLRPDHLYRAIHEQTARVLDASAFSISLYDAPTDTATVVFHADAGSRERLRTTYRGSECVAIRERRAVLETFGDGQPGAIPWLAGARGKTRALICAPILRHDRVLGLIAAHQQRAGAYGAEDLELLAAVSDLAAVALENAHYVEELERRRREAEQLEEIGRALTASLEPPEVLDRTATAAHELIGADEASIWLIDPRGQVELATARRMRGIPIGTRFPLPEEVYQYAVRERKALQIEDVRTSPFVPPEAKRVATAVTALVVPLVADDEALGFLVLAQREARRFTHEEISLVERLSYQASIALSNARLHARIRSISLTDPLTGLPNRRHLEMFLHTEFAAARRGRRLSLVLFDLDHFKVYNDRVGHQAGDDALRAFARILLRETRAMNLASRYGGDEFLCVLAGANRRGALRHAGRIRKACQADGTLREIGVSAGVAEFDVRMQGPADLIRAADSDLYRQKGGRSRKRAPAE